MTAGHDLNVLGSKVAGTGITAGAGQVSLTAGNTLNVVAAADTQSSHSDTHSSGGLFGSDKAQSSADLSQTTAQASSLTGSHIQLQSGSDMTLQAAQIAGQSLHAQAGVVDGQVVDPNATLHIDAAINDLSESRSSSGHGLLTQSTSSQGQIRQTLQYTTIDVPGASQAGGPVQLQATGGIAVGASSLSPAGSTASGGAGVPTITVDLKQQAQQLASQPGLAYLGQLAQRNDVAWQQVQLASQSWDYQASGLTGAGSAIIAIAVAIATYGAASGLATSAATSAGMTTTAGAAGASTVAAAGAGVAGSGVAAGTVLTTTGAALSSAAAAGMSSLASEAAVSLAGNGGNIGQTLHDLGSSQSVRNIVAAMVTGGVGGALSGYSAGNLAAKTVIGCAAGAISGTGCQNGAESAAVTNAAAWTYNSMLGYDASAGPGKTPPPGTKDYPVYTPQANGQQPVRSEHRGSDGHGWSRRGIERLQRWKSCSENCHWMCRRCDQRDWVPEWRRECGSHQRRGLVLQLHARL